MSYLQHEHVEKCYYTRDDTKYLVGSNKLHFTPGLKTFLAPNPTESFHEVTNESYIENINGNFLEYPKQIYFRQNGAQFNKELSNTEQFLTWSASQFYEVDNDPPHLLVDGVHHVEEDIVHHVEEDIIHHLEESDGETSDDDGEDFCHLIDWNTRMPPMWERKLNPTTKMIEYYDGFGKVWKTNKPRILERFEVFDLTVQELVVAIARYDHGNSYEIYRKLRAKEETLHRSDLQPLALDALRIWKHEIESKLLHSGVMAANYDDKKKMQSGSVLDHLSAAERKQARIEQLRKQEDDRYRLLEQQRKANEQEFSNQNKERASKEQQFRQNVSDARQNRVAVQNENQVHQQEIHASSKVALDKAKKEEEKERINKEVAKEYEIKILNLLTEKSNGFTTEMLPTMYTIKYGEDWTPEKWFTNTGMKNNVINVFNSMHLRDEVVMLKSGNTTHVLRQHHYAKIQVHGFSNDDVVPMLSLTQTMDECIRKLKAEKVAALESQRRMTHRQKSRASVHKHTPRQSTKAKAKPKPKARRQSKPKPAFSGVDPGLPPFWEAKRNGKGRLYFIDHRTKRTTWDDPRPLPTGWRSGKNAKGRTYYINDFQKKTQWVDPRPPLDV